jgi:hypothetical protein
MSNQPGTVAKVACVTLGALTLAAVAGLGICDVVPRWLPDRAHDWFSAAALALVAFAYLAYQAGRGPSAGEWGRAALLAFAFLAWAANQVWPDHGQAIVLNDVAVAAFVVDVVLAMVGWPPAKALVDA